MSKYKYEVEILYIDADQNWTIKNLVEYGFWGTQEARRKEKLSSMTWEISGDNPMSKELALHTRIKFTKQFVAKGERVKSVKFREIGAVL